MPKEKAKDLIDKFTFLNIGGYDLAIESALICVDEIIEAIDWREFETSKNEFIYWQEVKSEIEKL